mgnify:FL=1
MSTRLPDFPRHWLAVRSADGDTPAEPHDHDLCEQIEAAITCLMTGGYRFTGVAGAVTAVTTVADDARGMERGR